MKTTEWVEYVDGDHTRIRATYGFDEGFAARTKQDPYFTITGEIEIKRYGKIWRDDAFGCVHEEIARRLPELAPLIKWHLVSTRQPLHYMANALFWFDEGQRLGWDTLDTANYHRKSSLEFLKTTIIYGACVKIDPAFDLRTCTRDQLKSWLAKRKRPLMAAFRKEVAAAGINVPKVANRSGVLGRK